MLLNRNELIAALFREADRAQRMKTPLSVIYCGIFHRQKWQSRLEDAAQPVGLGEIEKRITQILRCYDTIGRTTDDELVLILPGCSQSNAETMAKRLDDEVFAGPVVIDGQQIRLSAFFGVASGAGRSPLIILREAERTFHSAMAQRTSDSPGVIAP